MAKKAARKNLIAQLKKEGAAKSFEAHKGDELKLGAGANLPAGIDGGVAQVVEAKLDVHGKDTRNPGKIFMTIQAVVKLPEEYAGSRTSVFVPLYDTPGRAKATADDHWADALNEVRKITGDTSEISIDDFEDVLDSIKQDRPHIRFRTWAGSKQELDERADGLYVTRGDTTLGGPFANEAAAKAQFPYVGREPMVNEDWRGVAAGFAEDNGEMVAEEAVEEEYGAEEEVEEEEEQAEISLTDLGEMADEEGDDSDAAAELSGHAKLAGVDPDEYETWAEVATAIREKDEAAETEEEEEEEAEEEEGGEEEEAEEDWEPQKEEMYLFKPQGAKQPKEVEVTAVYSGKRTVNLKSSDDPPKLYKNISWDRLLGEE